MENTPRANILSRWNTPQYGNAAHTLICGSRRIIFAMSTLRISHFSSCSRYHSNHLSYVMSAGSGTSLVCRSNKPICLEGFSPVTRITHCWPFMHYSSFWPSHSPSFWNGIPIMAVDTVDLKRNSVVFIGVGVIPFCPQSNCRHFR